MLARLVRSAGAAGFAHAARPPLALAAAPVRPPRGPCAIPWFSAPDGAGCRWLSVSKAVGMRHPVALREEDLDESFVKGSGKGGQKINKVRNCVLLKHVPTGLLVRCQKTRSLDDNRRVARKLLLQKLDDHVNGALSVRSVKIDRLRKKKKNKRARAKAKYGASAPEEEGEDGEDGEDDSDEEEDGEDSEDEEQRP